MYGTSRTALHLLAAGSGVLLVASLVLPTVVVFFFAPPAGLIFGVGSVWTASKVLTFIVGVVLLAPIVVPCFASEGRKWWLPLPVTVLATLALVGMLAVNFAETNGFGFTILGIVALALLSLCTLAEALVARRRTKPAPPAF
ncbi:MAG: hypothetical protein JW741_21460 [Sedimentisphaerales bacterium]|nr:hypothetical protein [Sedimentisphaerales bacterium]